MTNPPIWPGGARERTRKPKYLPGFPCGLTGRLTESSGHGCRGGHGMKGLLGGVPRRPARGRRVQAVIDSAAWVGSLVVWSLLRLGSGGMSWWRLVPLVPLVVVAQLGAGTLFGLY